MKMKTAMLAVILCFQSTVFASSEMNVEITREEIIELLEERKELATNNNEIKLIEQAIEKVELASEKKLEIVKVMLDQTQEIAGSYSEVGVAGIGFFVLLALIANALL